jgi:hypothetical protein
VIIINNTSRSSRTEGFTMGPLMTHQNANNDDDNTHEKLSEMEWDSWEQGEYSPIIKAKHPSLRYRPTTHPVRTQYEPE